jgi:ubiquinone/menaquinone biosynthesis C-methylase UbiE
VTGARGSSPAAAPARAGDDRAESAAQRDLWAWSVTERLPDPWSDVDAQPDAVQLGISLEARGETATQARLRRRFLRFAHIAPGARVLEIGSGTGVVSRDIARLVGPRGRVIGIDSSRTLVGVARRLARRSGGGDGLTFRVGDGARLPFRRGSFDATLAVTVFLHVAAPEAVLAEMIRVTRSGGVIGVQDQDFGTVVLAHPDPALTRAILDGVASHIYPEPHSGRRLSGMLSAAGLRRVRLQTEVYQDTTLQPYTRTFLQRRAENAVRLHIVDPAGAQKWLEGFTGLARAGGFVMTMNYYGAVGIKP